MGTVGWLVMFLLLTSLNHMNTHTHLGVPAKNRTTLELFGHSCCAKTPAVPGFIDNEILLVYETEISRMGHCVFLLIE